MNNFEGWLWCVVATLFDPTANGEPPVTWIVCWRGTGAEAAAVCHQCLVECANFKKWIAVEAHNDSEDLDERELAKRARMLDGGFNYGTRMRGGGYYFPSYTVLGAPDNCAEASAARALAMGMGVL